MIVKTNKTEFKLKNCCVKGNTLLSEDGEVIDLYAVLNKTFGEGSPFGLSAMCVYKDEEDH